MKKSYVIIGLGLFGAELAIQLYEKGENVLAIDSNAAVVEEMSDKIGRVVVADAKKRDVLKQLGVDKCDCAIVAMTADLAASVLITMNLKDFGIPEIICKAQNDLDKEALEKLGATKVIIPEKLAADRLYKKWMLNNVLEYIELSEKCGIVEMLVPKSWVNKSIKTIDVRAKHGVNILALRHGKDIEVTFDSKYILKESDVLILIGDNNVLSKIQGIP